MARRVVAHCDIDAFYASVELRKHPELRGRPLVVAGTGPRSVVTTASYEARRFGVDSAMPAARARALCPQAVFLPPDFEAYSATSREVWGIVRDRIERVQQVGIDEAYCDVTQYDRPLALLRDVVAEVRERTGMVVSVGVGPSRLVAKTSSAAFKPNAFAVLSREQACAHFAGSPARILQGIGPKTAERLAAEGLRTVGDLQRADEAQLVGLLGERSARWLHRAAHFHDDSEVATRRGPAKSRSNETTFNEDIADHAELERVLVRMAHDLCEGLARKEAMGRTVRIKVRLDDWTTVTRARTLRERTHDPGRVAEVAAELLRAYAPPRPVRLLGVGMAAFEDPEPRPAAVRGAEADAGQLVLPVAPEDAGEAEAASSATPSSSRSTSEASL
jgi:DNA polymerase-4